MLHGCLVKNFRVLGVGQTTPFPSFSCQIWFSKTRFGFGASHLFARICAKTQSNIGALKLSVSRSSIMRYTYSVSDQVMDLRQAKTDAERQFGNSSAPANHFICAGEGRVGTDAISSYFSRTVTPTNWLLTMWSRGAQKSRTGNVKEKSSYRVSSNRLI